MSRSKLQRTGLPEPWVTVEPRVGALHGRAGNEGDVITLAPGASPGPLEDDPRPAGSGAPSSRAIRTIFTEIAERLGWPDVDLSILRSPRVRRGFVAGRIWLDPGGAPRRVQLQLCPNADPAEVWATLLHEAAHAQAGARGHGPAFKAALLDLAAQHFSEEALAPARGVQAERVAMVDAWVAVCVRAALEGAPPPEPEVPDEGRTARLIALIRKMQALAESEPGGHEAVTATARANDLLTRCGLFATYTEVDPEIEAQMADRWLDVGRRVVWRRGRCCFSINARDSRKIPLSD